ncbi:hypothetical protein ACSBR2_030164 [Camellia fascicularis]
MVPGMKTGRRKKTATDPIASPSGTFAPVIVTPQTLSDETQPPDDTQTFVEETQAHGIENECKKGLREKKWEKLHVYVNRMLNALTGGNATPVTNELGLQIRQLCPLKGVKSWKKIDQSVKDAVVQAVLDTFEIGEDFHTDQQVQEIVNTKAYLLYKDWRYTLKQHYEKLVEEKRSKAGKENRSLLPYNHTSGSRSFPIAMSLMDAMVYLQATAMDAGIPLTHEELSRKVFGQKKNYLLGFGIGPRPYSPFDSMARSRDKQMEAM